MQAQDTNKGVSVLTEKAETVPVIEDGSNIHVD